MFAPALGIAEDPATGGAAGPLGWYLVRHGELLNFVAVARRVQWEAEGWTIPAPIDEFQQEFASFDEGTQTIISRAVEG